MKSLVIILLFSALLSGCEKSNYNQERANVFGDYPTTYHKLDSAVIKQKRTDYLTKNQYIHNSLNTFGFCDWDGDPVSRGIPPYKGDVSESEAKSIIKEFVLNNGSETGVDNLENLNFSRSNKETGYAGSILWYIRSQNQIVDDIEILNSNIIFTLTNKNLTLCLGNWYPDVYVPNSFNLDQAKAKSILIGQVVTYGSWSGAGSSKTIRENDLNGCNFLLKIIPVDYSDMIELRVCWQIYAPSLSYMFSVDVMTGEIVRKGSTIVN
jgi:hypothetical protein